MNKADRKKKKHSQDNSDKKDTVWRVYVTYSTVPLWISLPVFLFFLFVRRGDDLRVRFNPGVQSQDALEDVNA